MKKAVLLLGTLLFFSVFFLYPLSTTHAQKVLSATTQVSLSDALYADLAVRGDLDFVSIVYTDDKANNTVALNQDHVWLPASTVKLFVAMYAYKQIADGKLYLSSTVTIDAKNDVSTELVTDQLPALLIGDTVTVDRLIRQMITQSDNTAFNQLLDLLGRDNITTYVQSLGLTKSRIGSKLNLDDSQTQYEYDKPGYGINATTAQDFAKAFSLIKNNKIPGAKELFSILADQKINNMIPLYLPKTVVCAHKTGDLAPIYHDGGICEDKTHSYVMAIFTDAGDPNLLAHLSEIAYTKNYQLVGQSIESSNGLVGEKLPPIDDLVMNPPKTAVLAARTPLTFPVPAITLADLGINSSQLSLIIPKGKLPKVVIPADSPLHSLSDAWQMAQLLVAVGPKARMDVNLQTAKLRLAEAQDLQKKGKNSQASSIFSSVQNGLTNLAKDPTVTTNSDVQTTIQSVSQTRFSLLGSQLENTTGDQKLALIKQIATQAKETITKVQPHIPEGVSATSPTQKPLVGIIVASTNSSITVQTAGGQQITVPTNSSAVTIQEKSGAAPTITPTPIISGQTSPESEPTTSVTQSVTPTTGLTPGSTVALIGSSVDNHFAPAMILTNVPSQLAAPVPVTVAKVDTKNNTMVVEENGVFTQVDINQKTSIRGADTTIPLNSIQAGDVVIVHGAPLTQTQNTPSNPSSTPSTTTPATTTITPSVSPTVPSTSPTQTTTTPTTPNITGNATPTGKPTLSPAKTSPTAGPSGKPKVTQALPTSSTKQSTTPSVTKPATSSTTVPTTAPKAPIVIQSTSVVVIEKKADITSSPSQPKPVQSAPQPQPQPAPKSQPPQQSAPAAPANTTSTKPTDSTKKK